jgi:hypothetical protein
LVQVTGNPTRITLYKLIYYAVHLILQGSDAHDS